MSLPVRRIDWGLRDYGVENQLGLEQTPEQYVANMVAVFREVKRVLRDDGAVWLNLGDSYASSTATTGGYSNKSTLQGYSSENTKGRVMNKAETHRRLDHGLKPKDLVGIPWRVALALQADGWWLRNDIIWHKSNPMPESVTDRCTKSHEYIFLLAKSRRYYYDHEAIKEPFSKNKIGWLKTGSGNTTFGLEGQAIPGDSKKPQSTLGGRPNPSGRNKRTVWTITTKPYRGAHYACVDKKTEALTPLGWKRQDELSDGDLIAGYDPQTDHWRWQRATFHRYDYDGKMVQIEKRETSQMLTPEHRCPIRRKKGHQGSNGWGFDVKMAHQLQPAYELLLSSKYKGTSTHGVGTTLAALLGWFVTDGGIRKNRKSIRFYQSQSANGWKCDQIRQLLDDYGAEYTENTRKRKWRGRDSIEKTWDVTGQLAKRLLEIAPDKKLTPEMTELPTAEIRSLFEAIVDGDGCRRSDGRLQIAQKNKEHIDSMQIVAVRLGYKTVLSKRKDGGYSLFITDKKWLTLRGAGGVHNPIPTTHYKGIVWCPSVETGFWVARRNGKTFVTGNTFPPEIPELAIKAGTSEKGRCPKCGAPWERVVKKDNAPHDGKSKTKFDKGDNAGRIALLRQAARERGEEYSSTTHTVGWQPTCDHDLEPVPCVVLDPFVGSGTTCMVARELGRHSVGLDLSFDYLENNARKRLQLDKLDAWTNGKAAEGGGVGDLPMFSCATKKEI